MKRICLALVCCIAMVGFLSCFHVRTAEAYLTFSKAFLKKYAADEATDAQKSIAQEFKRVKKCGVCHDPRPGNDGKPSKKNRNPYGQALNKFLNEKDKKDLEKAIKMLAEIENQKAEGAEKTFGDLIKEGKLPFLYKDFDYSGGKEDEDDDK